MKSSSPDTRRNILERLRNQERSRDWAAISSQSRYPKPRRWSAESGHGTKNRRQYVPRSGSPQYLPRLKSPPEHQRDLRRGKLDVVPPVWSPRKDAFVGKNNGIPQKKYHCSHSLNATQWPGTYGNPVIPAVPPYQYSNGQLNHQLPMVPNPATPYPGVYPVPMYMGYAPMLPLQASYPGGVPMGSFVFGGQAPEQRHRRRMTRSQAATSIQRHFRGWMVRKSSRLQQLRWLAVSSFARNFTEDLIDEFLTEEILIDLLIDVLSHKKTLSPHDPRYKLAGYICSDLINEDVATFINQIAASVYYSQVPLHHLPSDDPLCEICQELINEVVAESGFPIVHSAIDDLVSGHMTEIKKDDWLEDLILETTSPMVYNVVTVTLDGYKYECVLDELIEEVTVELTKPVITEAWRETIMSHRNNQSQEISNYAEGRVLDSLCLQHLLAHLAGNNLPLYFRDYTEQTMEGLMCGILSQQYMLVYDQEQETLSNHALREYHQELHADLALDVILDELSAHLDEDMEDWWEKQKAADVDDYLFTM